MNIFIVADETSFYHPDFLHELLKKNNHNIVGAALVTKIPEKNSLERYLIKHFYFLKPKEMIKLAYIKYTSKFLNFFSFKKNFYSVKSVFKHYNINFFEVEDNINQEIYINQIKKLNIDVILSSNSLYFGEKILSIPKICSINRHTALLPSYGGLWPIFHAYKNNEKYTGVSAHLMTKKIDGGKVISQKKIQINSNDTIADLYKKCFKISSSVVLDALEKISNKDFSEHKNNNKESYFSFPSNDDWKKFRKKGGIFI